MPTENQKTATAIIEAYAIVRKRLTEEEKPIFDDAVSLIEKLSDIPDPSARIKTLDAALIAGLLAVNSPAPVLHFLTVSIARIIKKVEELSSIMSIIRSMPDGRRNSN